MDENERAIREAIKSAFAQEMDEYELKAWAQWGTPEQRWITTLPVKLARTLSPDVIADRCVSTARAEIRKLGFSEAEAAAAHLTFEAVPLTA
jgi:hypothetical protein